MTMPGLVAIRFREPSFQERGPFSILVCLAFGTVIASMAFAYHPANSILPPRKANLTTAYERCVGNSFYTDIIRACTAAENHRAEILMDAAYRKALSTLLPDQRRTLLWSQAKWQRRIEIECDRDPRPKSVEGGTLWPIFYTQCFMWKTRARTTWLKERYLDR